MSNIYFLKPNSDSLHSFFSKDLEPALAINSGDTVNFQTLDSAWGLEKRTALGQPRKKFTEIKPNRQSHEFGHALVGPVYINQAKPGQTLEIKINEVIPGSWGWTSAGGLDQAVWIALNEMLDLMSSLYHISRTEAYAYASMVVDLRITQIVNFSKGVHAILPFNALR
ncbi:hypothetical protein [Bacillus chungangensis]|uniref:Acetamidase/formamidase n=1 Tax=Bacillus chungangensis TaxID=587633 RepID=A0ABT9WQ18_9BACI|nr:hypothetical protein [Bacillus chungangensis]MDQ0175387.1 acetamidase/formamidase [Bacillus chungangensis]